MNNVIIYDITLGDKPVVEEPKAEEPATDKPAIEVTGNEYVIQAGDTLSAIAKACGLTVKDLVEANDIKNADLIHKGTKLVIPTIDTSKRHIVVAGDTLSKLAKQYGCTVADLVEINNIKNADLIYVDQLLLLP